MPNVKNWLFTSDLYYHPEKCILKYIFHLMILTNIFGQNIKESKLCQLFIIIKDPSRYIPSC